MLSYLANLDGEPCALFCSWAVGISPPAPEGWDKDINTTNTTNLGNTLTTPGIIYFLPVFISLLTPVLLITVLLVLLYLYFLQLVCIAPRPPAPEGWDKDINTITFLTISTIYTTSGCKLLSGIGMFSLTLVLVTRVEYDDC